MAYELHFNFKMFNIKRKQICIGTFSKIKIANIKLVLTLRLNKFTHNYKWPFMFVLLFPFLIVAVNSNTFDGVHLARPILPGGMEEF